MAVTNDVTTLVCLFHHQDHAQAASQDLLQAGVPESSITRIDNSGSAAGGYAAASLERLGVPERDQRHLVEGLTDGGVIVAVTAASEHVDRVEDIFKRHQAKKIDEVDAEDETALPLAGAAAVGGLAATGEQVIPIVEEELVVGKRTVDQGGVRLYRRVVEVPVEESVTLREEHVQVERRPVDRAVTPADMALQGERTIELTETAEEAVVGKTARVVEEVVVGKTETERTQHIHDTVRQTQVDLEEVPSTEGYKTGRREL